MSLDQLADRIIDLSETGQSTIVLVTPPEFSLRTGFFLELVEAIERVCDRAKTSRLMSRGIEIDCYQQPGGIRSMFSDLRSRRQASKLQLCLQRGTEFPIQVRWTAILGRHSNDGPLVIGCCDSRQTLPTWATPVELSKMPSAA